MAIIKHKNQRVGIFIDTQNLYHSAKNLYRSKVNFGQVVKEALAGRNLIRAVAYVIRTESEEEKGFFEALNKIGIERSEEHTSELQSQFHLVCRLLLEKKYIPNSPFFQNIPYALCFATLQRTPVS